MCERNEWPKGSVLLSKELFGFCCVSVCMHTLLPMEYCFIIYSDSRSLTYSLSLTNSVTSYDSFIVLNDVTVSLVFNLHVCLFHVYLIEYEHVHVLVDFAFGATHVYVHVSMLVCVSLS